MEKINININRLPWLDVSRGIVFLMVIYSHLEYCDPCIMRFFSPVFLTTFFFVSGYLFKSGFTFWKVFEQRTRTLLVPFLILGFSLILLSHIVTTKDVTLTWTDSIKGLLFQNGQNELLWFIAALYLYSLVFYWIERMSGKYILWVSLALFVINWLCFYSFYVVSIPWHIDKLGFGCAYMGLGKWFRNYENKFSFFLKFKYCLMVFVVYVLFIIWIDKSISFYGSKYLIDSLFITLIGLFLIIFLSKKINFHSRFLSFVGANTLLYFAFHGKVYAVLQVLTDKLFVNGYFFHSVFMDDIIGFVIVLIDALLLIPVALLVNQYFPWVLGKGWSFYK